MSETTFICEETGPHGPHDGPGGCDGVKVLAHVMAPEPGDDASLQDLARYHVARAQGFWVGFMATPDRRGRENCTTVYLWDETFKATHDAAIAHGFEQFGSDDFNVGQVIDGVVAWLGWMHEEFTDPEDRAEVAQALGFRVPRAAVVTPSRTDRQPPTSATQAKGGERGKTEVRGITFRDLRDCFVRACFESSGLSVEEWPGRIYDLPWDDMDIIAVAQNLTCNVEKRMGIYPNVPRLLPTDPTEKHWCGPTLDSAEWTSHEGPCAARDGGQADG